MDSMYYVYILKSGAHKRFYIGASSDIKKRLAEHNKGNTKSTKPYRPWELIYVENFESKSEAHKREFYLKHPKGYLEKLKIINGLNGGIA
ncbi:MAG: GIY-YIG nuclease family protein [Patescibacteria group bacterium]